MSLTIFDRRQIMNSAASQPDFRDLMRRDPRSGIEQAIGRSAPEGPISVIEEQGDAWEFVVPAGAIEAELPDPDSPRSAIENDVYALLRDEPEIRSRVVGDPKGLLAEMLDFNTVDAGINVREEQPGEVLIVLPYRDSRDELNDEALDLVAGGQPPACIVPVSADYKRE